jgi:hypothetical protein
MGTAFDPADGGRICRDIEGNEVVITDSGMYPCITGV